VCSGRWRGMNNKTLTAAYAQRCNGAKPVLRVRSKCFRRFVRRASPPKAVAGRRINHE
jgi:hypothetical protein